MKFLSGKKTYIIAGLMCLVSLLHLITGEMTMVEFVASDYLKTLLEALGLSALRAGVNKGKVY